MILWSMVGFLVSGLALASAEPASKAVLGGLERIEVRLESSAGGKVGLAFEARIDTGATETCLDAVSIKRIKRGGSNWVQFRTRVGSAEHEVQAPFVKTKGVRSSNGMSEIRTFVRLDLCVGNRLLSTVVSLADRHKMRQSVLVGRSLLEGRYLVDVDSDYLAGDPDCR